MSFVSTSTKQPLISIITATYNSERFIKDTYDSILSQTYCNWEWIITDDCSTDNTYNILRQIESRDSRVKIERNIKNSGAAVSRNNCFRRSNGMYFAFLDSDDIWIKEKLHQQLDFMMSGCDFSFTAYEIIDENRKKLNRIIDFKQHPPIKYKDLLKKNATIGCSTVMLRRSACEGLQMPLLRTGQDYATWLLVLKNGVSAYHLPQVLTQYRIVKNSISRNKIKKAKRQWQIYREIEKLDLIQSIICFCHYSVKAIIR
ncbi:glycosyltransferase family 2 protein [Buttiauxella gaviniae]|uniref:glycosyltransferase family 2 protein n=1 Tax=Buttiauxella gaviniae TaxID=82990 RepID=UPI0039B093CE